MSNNIPNWTKKELEIYILLLCSNADSKINRDELNVIKSKVDLDAFGKIFKEFSEDTEDEGLEKIDDSVHQHDFSPQEIMEIRTNMKAVFLADNKFDMKEDYLDRILDNMLY